MILIAGCGKVEGMGSNSTGIYTETECQSNESQEKTQEEPWQEKQEEPQQEKTEEPQQEQQQQPEELQQEKQPETTDETGSEAVKQLKNSVENFLKTALLPVGSTMYVWGGGWNKEDTGAGEGATTLGVLPQWAEFAALQGDTYDYKEHKYEILNGLDCSGYIGWAVYNVFEEENGKEGYVYKSTDTAKEYSELGWGELLENPEQFLPGDVVSMKGHVWISLGMCEDGSVVLLHASPPGVSICGTPADSGRAMVAGTGQASDTGAKADEDGNVQTEDSLAVQLAEKYMTAYYPAWQEKYPKREVKATYTENVTALRWNEETFSDAEKWQALSAEEVLKRLFEE